MLYSIIYIFIKFNSNIYQTHKTIFKTHYTLKKKITKHIINSINKWLFLLHS